MPVQKETNILLVEDNPGDVKLVEFMLMEQFDSGLTLTCHTNMADAIQAISLQDFDVVLLDMTLPDGQGIENITRIKIRSPALPIVVMTSQQDDEFDIESVRAGAQDYLIKGEINEWQLLRALRYSIERKHLQEQVIHLANHDQLTGLANRGLFRMRLEHAIICAERRDELAAVLYIDLDHFKPINDSLGHFTGDKILCEVARRLAESVREIDTVARLGGDEFAIVLEGVSEEEGIAAVAKKIIQVISTPYRIDNHIINIGISIGISIYPYCGADTETIINNADIALFKAKSNGRNQYKFHENIDSQRSENQFNIGADLRTALEKDEFELYYQPKYERISGEVSGSEALIRWNHPQEGLISPARFIPLLEKSGLITDVGKWVLESACKQYVLWQKSGLEAGKIAINLSGEQLVQNDFCDIVADIISNTSIDPCALELELTESLLIQNMHSTKSVLDVLKKMGVSVAIDDFGTGYNSFSYLKKFMFDTLKIDREFIKNITDQPSEAAITSAIISLAKELDINVVAEGVETLAQLEFVRDKKVDEIQGFYFSPPVTADVLEGLLFQQKHSNTPCLVGVS